MYYPYIRGKQYELLALKELSPFLKDSQDKVSPIIEPVRDSSTFKNLLKLFKNDGISFNIVINPLVGDLVEDIDGIITALEENLEEYSNYQIGVIIESTSENYYNDLFNHINKSSLNFNGYSLIHTSVLKNITEVESIFKNKGVVYNIIHGAKTNSDKRYHRNFDKETKVSIDNYFKAQARNADYLGIEYSDFSNDYLYYQEEGYVGFGDFLTVGDDYSEGGFRPYAVAIHISHINQDGDIVTYHFVSNSNGDVSDVAGKFSEANTKLVKWISDEEISLTLGLNQYKELHDSSHFPGLGVLKKLSVMHHIELVVKAIG